MLLWLGILTVMFRSASIGGAIIVDRDARNGFQPGNPEKG
jgi:hypothetical protein